MKYCKIIESINITIALEFRLFQQWGETAETLPELEELQNIRERLRSPYSRLHTLALLEAAESQPVATDDVIARSSQQKLL